MSAEWEIVIGLETHVQLGTRTKLFCSCSVAFGEQANASICPVCTGQPGSLPVLNKRAVELGFTAGLALECDLAERSVFARKNYFYPDLPKGYQISQYDRPFASNGRLAVEQDFVSIERIHLEEDAGKLVHEAQFSGVDLGRAGTPLIEIVTRPEIFSAERAYDYLTRLKAVMQYCGVSTCNMEKGELRCDANVSVRRPGEALGTRVEIKNLNSFKAVKESILFEYSRQCRALEVGETIVQETRLWDPDTGRTRTMRVKEEEHDYRYFPDPDLVPLEASEDWLYSIRATLPELPGARRDRFMSTLGLTAYDADILVAEKPLADYFESVLASTGKDSAKTAANWIQTEFLAKLKETGVSIEQSPVSAGQTAELLSLVASGKISGRTAKEIFGKTWETGKSPSVLVDELGLSQVSDEGQLGEWVDEAIAENPKAVADIKSGNGKAVGAIVGMVMKKSKGKANPSLVNKMIQEKLA